MANEDAEREPGFAGFQYNRISCEITVWHNLLDFRNSLNAIIETIEEGREGAAIIKLNGFAIEWQSADKVDLTGLIGRLK